MTIVSATRDTWLRMLACYLLLVLIIPAYAQPVSDISPDPVAYLNFNEGSGITALDASGNGNAGTLHNVSRQDSLGCGGALVFDRPDNYISIPYRSTNHPEKEITVSTWFFVDSFDPQMLVSTYHDGGGYRLGFGDGNDLWWTVNLGGTGEVSIPVQHEGISPRQWHYVIGMYDGQSSKIYLDGVLRNQMKASGPIVYQTRNYVILGANAGISDTPDRICPQYLHGGLDEVRIYDQAIPYSRIMDDRFSCSQDPLPPSAETSFSGLKAASCYLDPGTIHLVPGESMTRTIRFANKSMTGTWQVDVQPGSKLVVTTRDLFSQAYPDAWYMEIADEQGRIDRTIAFPNTNNAPLEGVIRNGNATVNIRYFDGKERFPATVAVQFTAISAPPLPPTMPQNILSNPIIVIYSASWATLIALILVILWLHRRSREKQQAGTRKEETNEPEETKND